MTDITSYVGDTLKLKVRAYQDSTRKVPLPLSGKVVEFIAVNRAQNPTRTVTKTVGDGIEVMTPDTGIVEVTLDPADTTPRGVLLYTIRVEDGDEVYTLAVGKISFVDPH